MKSFNVCFSNRSKGVAEFERNVKSQMACVVASDLPEAVLKAEKFCKKEFPDLQIEHIQLDRTVVIQ